MGGITLWTCWYWFFADTLILIIADISHCRIIIDHKALLKQGDNALGSVRPLVRLSVRLSGHMSVLFCLNGLIYDWTNTTHGQTDGRNQSPCFAKLHG